MKHKKKYLSILLILCCAFLSSCGLSSNSPNDNLLYIHFFNVGQGDSALIQYKNKNLLIDAGPTASKNDLIKYLDALNVKDFNAVVATHPHEDHIGGMKDVINKYKIDKFYAPKKITSSKTFEGMVKALKSKNLKITTAKSGKTIDIDENLKINILAPITENVDSINNNSAIIKLTFKNTSFLFTGDAEKEVEKELMEKDSNLSSDVLKISHHGSSSSSSDSFLNTVSPKIAVISCGKDNPYGHPHKETLKKLKKKQIKTYMTSIDGTITFISDGNTIKKSP